MGVPSTALAAGKLPTEPVAGHDVASVEAYPEFPVVDEPMPRWQIAFWRLVGLGAIVAIWWAIVELRLVTPLFMPTPLETFREFVDMLGTQLLSQVWITLSEALRGFALGTAVGILLGLVIGVMPRVNEVVAPFISVFNATPRIALAPLFVLWFGLGSASHVVLVFTIVLPTVLINTIAGARSVEKEYVVVARLLGAGRREIVRKIVIPTTVPWVITAMRLSWSHALTAAVVAEMFLGQSGLGFVISTGSGTFGVAQIFAAVALCVSMAFLGDNALRFGERRLLRWRQQPV
jgi:NitT/TauT family transport system permease protein